MRIFTLDTKELLGYRLLSDAEISSASVTSIKAGGKGGTMAGMKNGPRPTRS